MCIRTSNFILALVPETNKADRKGIRMSAPAVYVIMDQDIEMIDIIAHSKSGTVLQPKNVTMMMKHIFYNN